MAEKENINFEFILKTRLKCGPGEALKLGDYLKELKFGRIGVIVDSGIFDADYVNEILSNVKKNNFAAVKIFKYDFGAEPDYASLDKVKLEFLDESSKPNVDCFVGIGGGSVIDFAKGLATVVVNPGKAISYRGFPTEIIIPLPVIAIPTTAGTASEVTYNAVFIDLEEKKKLGINTTNNFPVLAILDPKLVATCPRKVAISSGMDALTHTLESYVAVKANLVTRIFAKEAFRLVFNNLLKALDNKDDIEAWSNLQIGAYLAGISLMNSGSGPAGALSYTLGVRFKVAHGLAGAVFLPYIIEHNVKNGYDYSELYDLIGPADKSLDKKEKSIIFSEKIFELCRNLDIPLNLKAFGVDENNINVLLSDADGFEKAFAQNAIPFSGEDGKKLLNKLVK